MLEKTISLTKIFPVTSNPKNGIFGFKVTGKNFETKIENSAPKIVSEMVFSNIQKKIRRLRQKLKKMKHFQKNIDQNFFFENW